MVKHTMFNEIYDMVAGTSADQAAQFAKTQLGRYEAKETYTSNSSMTMLGSMVAATAGTIGSLYLANKFGISSDIIGNSVLLGATAASGVLSSIVGHSLTMKHVKESAEAGDEMFGRIQTHKNALGATDISKLPNHELLECSALLRTTDAKTDSGVAQAKKAFDRAAPIVMGVTMTAAMAGVVGVMNVISGHNIGSLAFPLISMGAMAAGAPFYAVSKMAMDWYVKAAGRKGDEANDVVIKSANRDEEPVKWNGLSETPRVKQQDRQNGIAFGM